MYVCMYVSGASAQGLRGRIPSRTDGQSPSNSGQEKPAPTQRYKRISVATSPPTAYTTPAADLARRQGGIAWSGASWQTVERRPAPTCTEAESHNMTDTKLGVVDGVLTVLTVLKAEGVKHGLANLDRVQLLHGRQLRRQHHGCSSRGPGGGELWRRC